MEAFLVAEPNKDNLYEEFASEFNFSKKKYKSYIYHLIKEFSRWGFIILKNYWKIVREYKNRTVVFF